MIPGRSTTSDLPKRLCLLGYGWRKPGKMECFLDATPKRLLNLKQRQVRPNWWPQVRKQWCSLLWYALVRPNVRASSVVGTKTSCPHPLFSRDMWAYGSRPGSLLHSSSSRSSVFLLALPKTSPEIISPAYRIRSRLLGCTACISWTRLVKLPKDLPTQTRIKHPKVTPYLPKRLSAPTRPQGVFPKGPTKNTWDPRSIPTAPWDQPWRSTRPEALQISPRALVERDFAWNSFFLDANLLGSLYHPRSLTVSLPLKTGGIGDDPFLLGPETLVKGELLNFRKGRCFGGGGGKPKIHSSLHQAVVGIWVRTLDSVMEFLVSH